jgi:methylmalonyl-CoA mutase N-terminal domain/subunit
MNAPKEAQNLAALEKQLELWERNEVASFLNKQQEREEHFLTLGGLRVKRVYTALDSESTPLEDIGLPGQYPFTRGP